MVKSKKTTKKAKVVASPTKVKKTKKAAKVVDFRVYREPTPFLTFKITEQTVYWFVMLSLLLVLGLWVLDIHNKTTYILESISLSFM